MSKLDDLMMPALMGAAQKTMEKEFLQETVVFKDQNSEAGREAIFARSVLRQAGYTAKAAGSTQWRNKTWAAGLRSMRTSKKAFVHPSAKQEHRLALELVALGCLADEAKTLARRACIAVMAVASVPRLLEAYVGLVAGFWTFLTLRAPAARAREVAQWVLQWKENLA